MASDSSTLADKLLSSARSLAESFNQLDKNRKLLFGCGVILILVIVASLAAYVLNPHYTALYTNLDTQDAASIAQYLKDQKIPFQLADQGTTITVPESQKYQVRLDLANNNLPKDDIVGFESLNQNTFGETESDERVRYNIALQGELERTIDRIDGVEDVRVHIVSPDPSLFVTDTSNATAAVLLKLRPGYSLQDSQVQGIAHLVASGVEGLKPENVSILDTTGNLLSDDPGSDDTATLTTDQLKMKQAYDSQLQSSVQSMLERVVGPGNAIVRADASLNFDQVQITSENYGDKQVSSDHTVQETASSSGAQGAPGTSSNIPLYQQITTEGGNPSNTTDENTNYDVDTQTEQRVVAPGQIKQISLAVVLNSDQMDPQQQQQIESMVTSAAGIDPSRGDKVTVAAMPFNNDLANQATAQMNTAESRHELLTGLEIVLGFILFLVLLKYLGKAFKTVDIPKPAESISQVSVDNLMAAKQLEMAKAEEKHQVLDRLRQVVNSQPGETVEVLRAWLASE